MTTPDPERAEPTAPRASDASDDSTESGDGTDVVTTLLLAWSAGDRAAAEDLG